MPTPFIQRREQAPLPGAATPTHDAARVPSSIPMRETHSGSSSFGQNREGGIPDEPAARVLPAISALLVRACFDSSSRRGPCSVRQGAAASSWISSLSLGRAADRDLQRARDFAKGQESASNAQSSTRAR